MRKSAFDSYAELPLLVKRKDFRRKRSSRDLEDHDEQNDDQTATFPCSLCNREIHVPGIFFHKKQHAALATLGFQWMGEKKPGPSVITRQRQLIITKLLSSSTFTEKTLQSVNNAFELLWKKQMPAYYKITDNIHRNTLYSQKTFHFLIKGIAICEDRNSTWRTAMNDKFTVVNNFGKKPNVCFLGLFDGHHGASAAALTSTELPVLLLHQLSRFDSSYQMTPEEHKVINSFHTLFREDYLATEDLFSSINKRTEELKCEYEDIHKAFAKAFWRMDRLLRLGRKEVSRVRWSGCSAVTCLLEGSIKSPFAKNWRRINDRNCLAERFPCQIISGILHIANTGSSSFDLQYLSSSLGTCQNGNLRGNVQAVLCRNGKGFCLTKEHTTRNINERRRLLQGGAVISSNEPYGLLEGQIKTTRGLGFHGNLKLKKFVIPAPQTISVPIDDLCQFLILATNGLWEVLDKKEVTALAMMMFQAYKEVYSSLTYNKSSFKKSLFSPINEPSNSKSDGNTHILFQFKSESKECVPATNTKENMPDSKYFKHFTYNPKNTQTFAPEMTYCDPYSQKETDGPTNGVAKDSIKKEKESCAKSFYEGAAEHVSRELVNAALVAGSRDNISVMVVLLSGSEYQFLT
ncbi:hypothetical protein MC885_014310 [Smutsia gigantea]|nr:hypothetical protein MC885_014310 [Smutsia gigantea]